MKYLKLKNENNFTWKGIKTMICVSPYLQELLEQYMFIPVHAFLTKTMT